MKFNWAEKLRQNVHGLAESLGNLFVESFHYLALFAIGAVTAWAAVVNGRRSGIPQQPRSGAFVHG